MEGLKGLFYALFSTEEQEILHSLTAVFRSAFALSDALRIVEALLARPDLAEEAPRSLEDIARRYSDDKTERETRFSSFQAAHELAASALFDSLAAGAQKIFSDPNGTPAALQRDDKEASDYERASAKQPRSVIRRRIAALTTPEGDELRCILTGHPAPFRRPWPLGDPPTLLDTGQVNLVFNGRSVLLQAIEMHFAGHLGSARFYVGDLPGLVPIDEEWLSRVLRLATGLTTAAVASPYHLRGIKTPIDQFPPDVLLIDGDLDPSFRLVTGIKAFQQSIDRFLNTRPGDVVGTPELGTNTYTAFHLDGEECEALLFSVLRDGLVPRYAPYIDVVESFDLVNRGTTGVRTIDLILVIWPHGHERCVWRFRVDCAERRSPKTVPRPSATEAGP
jgi:hypothetical protein